MTVIVIRYPASAREACSTVGGLLQGGGAAQGRARAECRTGRIALCRAEAETAGGRLRDVVQVVRATVGDLDRGLPLAVATGPVVAQRAAHDAGRGGGVFAVEPAACVCAAMFSPRALLGDHAAAEARPRARRPAVPGLVVAVGTRSGTDVLMGAHQRAVRLPAHGRVCGRGVRAWVAPSTK